MENLFIVPFKFIPIAFNDFAGSKQNDVFMQVVVRKDPITEIGRIRENQRMQLVFKQNQANHDSRPTTKSSLLKGRGKDTFFLVAQDEDTPEVVRDLRKVPKNVLNQVTKPSRKKPFFKSSKIVPTFPNYPVHTVGKSADDRFSFHQAYGTDFQRSRPPVTTTVQPFERSTVQSTTKKPSFILTPPDLNAPVAKFYR